MTSEPPSGHAREHKVAMRDGVELATDVYLPDAATVHSAILVRTCHDKSSRYTALTFEAEYYRARGFAFVTQDVRGKFRSAGETLPYGWAARSIRWTRPRRT
ncbi:CocE/NonD family hydrolase [Streptomyces sp. NPDC058459]|uniref:CocE/NonD family hydrolase n=1 Tax=Streptomyces sp. NPDC058459 TaxID=3346508 RepID=UPI00364E4649